MAKAKRRPLSHVPQTVYEQTPIVMRIQIISDQSELERVDKPDSLKEYGDKVDYFRYLKSVLPEMIGREFPMSHEQIIKLYSYKLITISFNGNS